MKIFSINVIITYITLTCIASAQTSPWGVSTSHTSAWAVDTWSQQIKESGINVVRAFRPSKDDVLLNSLLELGFEVTGILQWSSNNKKNSIPVDDLEGWKRYVAEMIVRYEGKIRKWEVWNEPPNFTEDKRPESYAKIVLAAYQVAKSLDPNVEIGIATKSTNIDYLSKAIDAGAKNNYDFISLHPYEIASTISRGYDALYMNIVPATRKMLNNHNPEKVDIPILFTEIATSLDKNLSKKEAEHNQANNLIKLYVMGLAQGVERIDWYEPTDNEFLELGLIGMDGKSRASLKAYNNLINLLGSQPKFIGWTQPNFKTNSFLFFNELTDEYILISWTPPDTSILLHSGKATYHDLLTGERIIAKEPELTISNTPIAISSPKNTPLSKSWIMNVDTKKTNIFLWNGKNYSESQLIKITAGNPSDGIHFINQPKIINTKSESYFSMSSTPNVSITVDPTFFTESNIDVELGIVLRSKEITDELPGFNLKAEAPNNGNIEGTNTGSTKWNSIKYSNWHIKKWIINNFTQATQFGHQISIYSDSSKYSAYDIKEIYIRKIN